MGEKRRLIDQALSFVFKYIQPPGRQSDKNGEAAGRKSRRKAVFARLGRRDLPARARHP